MLHWIPKPIIDSIHIQSLLYLLLWFGVFNYKTCRNTSKDLGHNSRTSFFVHLFRAVQLHDVLLLARKLFHLDLIQVYLKGRQSIFKIVTGQLVVFSTIVRLGCVAQPRLFSS